MNMSPRFFQIVVLVALVSATAFLAMADSVPPWSATVSVIDEQGRPLSEATVEISYYVKPASEQSTAGESVHGVTGTNGVFTASHTDTGSVGLGFRASKPGYYSSSLGQQLYEPGQLDNRSVATSRNIAVTMTLRKVGEPIPLYAKRVETKVPREDSQVGYDLMQGDWVEPFGSGKSSDVLFTVHRKVLNVREYNAEVELTFPNKGDGIAVWPVANRIDSEFRTERIAPESGYETNRLWRYTNLSGPEQVAGYFLRVRTVLDANGNVTKALY